MRTANEPVDGFLFLPPGLAAWIRQFIPAEDFAGPIPFRALTKPLPECTLAAVTSAGISLATEPPFDMERERREPTWGDPTYRKIPLETAEGEIQVNHLHINTAYIKEDINVILPLAHLRAFEREGIVGRAAPTAYSFYGFQWQKTDFIDQAIAPMAEQMRAEGVDAALLTPA